MTESVFALILALPSLRILSLRENDTVSATATGFNVYIGSEKKLNVDLHSFTRITDAAMHNILLSCVDKKNIRIRLKKMAGLTADFAENNAYLGVNLSVA